MWTRSAAALALLLTLTACGGGNPEPAPLPSPAPSTPTAAASSPTASASPTPPVLPKAAKAKTKAGAEALLSYYLSVMSYASRTGDSESLRDLTYTKCLPCSAIPDFVDDVYAAGGRIEGAGWKLNSVEKVVRGGPELEVLVQARILVSPQRVYKTANSSPEVYNGSQNRAKLFGFITSHGQPRLAQLEQPS